MKYLSATRIHDGRQWLPEGTILSFTEDGTIQALLPPGTVAPENIRHLEGMLCPGFVNAHCHMELSHMKDAVAEGKGLVPFLQAVMLERNRFTEAQKKEAIANAIAEMKSNGIVAVGDIANGPDTLPFRRQAGLHIHTFVESIGFTEHDIEARFAWPAGVYGQFAAQESGSFRLRQSIVPHAPYSVSEGMFARIDRFLPGSLLSIHNEETAAELELYRNKSGAMFDLYRTLGIDAGFFRPSGKTSLQTYLPYLDPGHSLLLVHNTFMEAGDLALLRERGGEVSLCLCPNANWHIERRLPPLDLLMASGLPVCIGTDSLASNHQLSVWSELLTLQQHFPEIPMETLLRWGTYNGACALQLEDVAGSFDPGKRCGIVHIDTECRIQMIANP